MDSGTGSSDAFSIFVLGGSLLLIFGVIALCRPPEADDYSDYMGKMANVMWPIGLGLVVISAAMALL